MKGNQKARMIERETEKEGAHLIFAITILEDQEFKHIAVN